MDDADKAKIEQDLQIAIGMRNAALAAAGTGCDFCVDCQEPIPQARRLACPWAVRCVDCQKTLEARR